MNAILDANNYVKMLLFQFSFQNQNLLKEILNNLIKCRDVQYGVTRVM